MAAPARAGRKIEGHCGPRGAERAWAIGEGAHGGTWVGAAEPWAKRLQRVHDTAISQRAPGVNYFAFYIALISVCACKHSALGLSPCFEFAGGHSHRIHLWLAAYSLRCFEKLTLTAKA